MKNKKTPKITPKNLPEKSPNNKQIIIDLNKLENISNNNKFLNTLLNNIFIIKNNEISIECKCEKQNRTLIKDFEIYEIYSINKNNNGFLLIFGNENGLKSNNTVYIESINKTPNLSGSSIIKTITKFITKFINIKQIILQDASTINCNKSDSSYSLTFFSLITNKKTFYGKYGFELYPNIINENKINKIIDKCANVKLSDILKELNLLLKHSLINVKNSQTQKNTDKSDFYDNINKSYPYLIGIIDIFKKIKNKNITFKDLLLKIKIDKQCTKISFILSAIKILSIDSKISNKYPFLYNISKIKSITDSIYLRIYYTKNNVK
jgi:hypothetical protein